jgi:hypothetical protein
MTSTQIWAAIAHFGPAIIAFAASAATVLPKPEPGTWYAVLRGVIDLLACNFGNAKNAP